MMQQNAWHELKRPSNLWKQHWSERANGNASARRQDCRLDARFQVGVRDFVAGMRLWQD